MDIKERHNKMNIYKLFFLPSVAMTIEPPLIPLVSCYLNWNEKQYLS